jgi:hypothetical protein
MCLIERYSKAHIGKTLSDSFLIKYGLQQGDALSPLFFKFALEYSIRKVLENQVRLKLNGIHQLLAYADDINLQRKHRHYKEKHTNKLMLVTGLV